MTNTPPRDAIALAVTDGPARDDIDFLDDRLYDFNVERTGFGDGRLLAIFLRDARGAIYAGLHGHTWGGCCEIKTLWVAEDRRGEGLGTKLLAAAEQEARARGCERVVLSSHSFQAPAFYRKRGYIRVGEAEGCPAGHSNIFMAKLLAR